MTSRVVSRVVVAGCAVAWLSACRDTNPVPQSKDVQKPVPHLAQLVVSDTAPAIGDTIRVSLMLSLAGDSALASFTARVSFDTTTLRYLGETPLAGGMRAYRRDGGDLRVAGVAAQGFAEGPLFAARFLVVQRGALASLRLAIDEAHDVQLRDLGGTIRAADGTTREAP